MLHEASLKFLIVMQPIICQDFELQVAETKCKIREI